MKKNLLSMILLLSSQIMTLLTIYKLKSSRTKEKRNNRKRPKNNHRISQIEKKIN